MKDNVIAETALFTVAGKKFATTTQPPPPNTGNETINVTQAQFRNDQKRWTVTGTDSALAGQLTVKWIHLVNGVSAATTLGTATVTATGAWNFDTRGVASKLIPQQGDPVTVTGPSGATKSANVSVIK